MGSCKWTCADGRRLAIKGDVSGDVSKADNDLTFCLAYKQRFHMHFHASGQRRFHASGSGVNWKQVEYNTCQKVFDNTYCDLPESKSCCPITCANGRRLANDC